MGYRVEYEPMMKNERNMDKFRLRPGLLTAAAFLTLCLLVNTYWPHGKALLQEILWPGDAAVTQQAVETFVSELHYGQPLGDAVEGFCREILKHENLG